MDKLSILVGRIKTRADLAIFIKALALDFANNPSSWENKHIDEFLEALSAWTEDMDGFYLNKGKPIPNEANWKMIGQMLLAAKYYE